MITFLQKYLETVAGAMVIMTFFYVIFWVVFGKKLSNRKIQLSKRAGWPQIKGEIIAAAVSFIGSTLFTMLMLTLKDSGIAKFYLEAGKYGIWYEVLTILVMILIGDTWFYWSHRVMHHPSIYKYVHALHHKSLDVNPYTSVSFHVIEAVWLTVWMLPLVMVMPISMTALGIMQVIGSLNNLKSHLGYELFPGFLNKAPFNILVTATNHSLHHTQYNGNYGLYFRFWDVVCGTELNTTSSTFEEIHHRTNETIIDNTKFKTLIIDQLVRENQDTVSVYFRPTDQAFYNYKAGQYLTLKVNIDGKTHTRCFSLSSSPNLDDFLRITVKLKREVSHYFYNNAKVGDSIQSLLPVGDNIHIVSKSTKNQYLMIAGGSGITPMYSILRQMLHFEPDCKVTLLYANSSSENVTFKKELTELEKQFSQFTYHDFISGQKRISKSDLAEFTDATIYMCGPDSLKDAINSYLKELKVKAEKIKIEHYADGYVPWFGLF